MDAKSMSPAELRALADQKESDDEGKVVKVGYLKMDLYSFDSDDRCGFIFREPWGDFWLKTLEERNELITKFQSQFSMVLPKGTKFNCYHYCDTNFWFDDDVYGVEEMDDTWAEKYLENITSV